MSGQCMHFNKGKKPVCVFWIHLCDILERETQRRQEACQWLAQLWWGWEDWTDEAQLLVGHWACFYDSGSACLKIHICQWFGEITDTRAELGDKQNEPEESKCVRKQEKDKKRMRCSPVTQNLPRMPKAINSIFH